jgi:hypothetical protein
MGLWVTRMGEYSPIGRLIYLGSFLSWRRGHNIWATFSTDKAMSYFDKNGLGFMYLLWAIFSQIHLFMWS